MGRLACAFAIISFVRHNHPFIGGNVILCDFVRANRLFTGGDDILCDFVRANRFFTGGDDISVVEFTKIWTDGKTEPFEPLLLDPLAAYQTSSNSLWQRTCHWVCSMAHCLPRWRWKSLTLARDPAQSALQATLLAKVNLRSLLVIQRQNHWL